ncbi:MAG: hypothetical protein Kow0069_32190 [Promethearchaeota archaeon]
MKVARETKWTLRFSRQNVVLHVTAIEEDGQLSFGFDVVDEANSKSVELSLTEEQFLNFVSILTGFKRGVVQESPVSVPSEDPRQLEREPEPEPESGTGGELSTTALEPGGSGLERNEKGAMEEEYDPDLDPRTWDPW